MVAVLLEFYWVWGTLRAVEFHCVVIGELCLCKGLERGTKAQPSIELAKVSGICGIVRERHLG